MFDQDKKLELIKISQKRNDSEVISNNFTVS